MIADCMIVMIVPISILDQKPGESPRLLALGRHGFRNMSRVTYQSEPDRNADPGGFILIFGQSFDSSTIRFPIDDEHARYMRVWRVWQRRWIKQN